MKNTLLCIMGYHLVSSGDAVLLWPSNKCNSVTGSLAIFLVRSRKIQWKSSFEVHHKSATKTFPISGLTAIMELVYTGTGDWSVRTTQFSPTAFRSDAPGSLIASDTCQTIQMLPQKGHIGMYISILLEAIYQSAVFQDAFRGVWLCRISSDFNAAGLVKPRPESLVTGKGLEDG